ncbi:MAG: hypothetical protein CSA62_00110 [Planctomycetota bacterium]|nr:MAG: hypothetical protein CSA62_00110 [Planctomycetota bacterium]
MVEARQDLVQDEANFEPIRSCTLCACEESREKFREGIFRIVECCNCGLVYVTPRLRPELLPRVYDENYWSSDSPKEAGYADYRSDAKLYLKTFERRYALIERFTKGKGRALDVGSAAGFFLKTLFDRGWHVDGVELSAEIVEHAKREYGFQDIHVGTIETSPFNKGSYDLLTMWDVVEHVPEPLPFLKESVSYLKEDGILILETQNVASKFAQRLGPKWQHYKHLEHLYHFNPSTIERLLDQAGLEILENTSKFGGKYVSISFIRERATRLHPVMRYLLLPLAPFGKMSLYVNPRDEMVIVARKKKAKAGQR